MKELQRHPIKGNVIHLDFLRVSADAEISVDVPIVLTGEAEKVERANGTIDHLLFSLTISAKPADIPNEITVDISDLDIEGHIRVGDLPLPAGVTTDVDEEEVVVIAQSESIQAEEPAEGAEGATEGGEAAADSDSGSDD